MKRSTQDGQAHLTGKTAKAQGEKTSRRQSNRTLAKLRSRMRGAAKRIDTLRSRREDLRSIIRNKYVTLESSPEGTSTIRRLSRVELREFRANLADVKRDLVTVTAEHRSYKAAYEKAVNAKHVSSLNRLKHHRSFHRAVQKEAQVLIEAKQLLLETASNGGRRQIEAIKKEISTGHREEAKSQLDRLLTTNKLAGFDAVLASGIVHDRFAESVLDDIESLDLNGKKPSFPTLDTLTSDKK